MTQEEKYKSALEQIVNIISASHLEDDIFSLLEWIDETAKKALLTN